MMALSRARDPAVQTVQAWRWRFQDMAARNALAAKVGAGRSSVELFDDAEELALLALAWEPAPPTPPTSPAELLWSADAERIASWRAPVEQAASCLVVVRQPLRAADPDAQRDWAATVMKALEGDPAPPRGLISANFFADRNGALVYNFAEWTSPEAHRAALRQGSYGQHGSIGTSDLWRATREHPAITPDHEVRRYVRHGAATLA